MIFSFPPFSDKEYLSFRYVFNNPCKNFFWDRFCLKWLSYAVIRGIIRGIFCWIFWGKRSTFFQKGREGYGKWKLFKKTRLETTTSHVFCKFCYFCLFRKSEKWVRIATKLFSKLNYAMIALIRFLIRHYMLIWHFIYCKNLTLHPYIA